MNKFHYKFQQQKNQRIFNVISTETQRIFQCNFKEKTQLIFRSNFKKKFIKVIRGLDKYSKYHSFLLLQISFFKECKFNYDLFEIVRNLQNFISFKTKKKIKLAFICGAVSFPPKMKGIFLFSPRNCCKTGRKASKFIKKVSLRLPCVPKKEKEGVERSSYDES